MVSIRVLLWRCWCFLLPCHLVNCCLLSSRNSGEVLPPCPGIPAVSKGLVVNRQDRQSFLIGETLYFDCGQGYVLKGSSTITCNEEGRWEFAGFCEELKCGQVTYTAKGGEPYYYFSGGSNPDVDNIGAVTGAKCTGGFMKIACNMLGQREFRYSGFCESFDYQNHHALSQAAARGDLNKVRKLLNLLGARLEVDWRDEEMHCCDDLPSACTWNSTALHRALLCSHIDDVVLVAIVKELIDRGADVSIQESSSSEETPLHLAAKNGKMDAVRLLLDSGAAINQRHREGWTALHDAAAKGHPEVVDLLLDRGADIDAKTSVCSDGCAMPAYTALMIAAQLKKPEVARLLIKRGATRKGCYLPLCQ